MIFAFGKSIMIVVLSGHIREKIPVIMLLVPFIDLMMKSLLELHFAMNVGSTQPRRLEECVGHKGLNG